MKPLKTFAALRHRNFRLFWLGQFVSLTGTWMQSIAQSWLVLELTQSPFMLGLVSTMSMLPVLIFALPAGALSDRMDKRRLLIVTQSAMMLLAFILAFLTLFKVVQVWHIILLASLLGIANAFDMPGRQSFVIELAGREDLLNAVALNSTAFNSARIIGPAIAGILIGTVGSGVCFLINALSFIAVIIGLWLIDTKPVPRTTTPESIVRDMIDGIRYIVRHQTILTLIILVGVFSIFGMPYTILMPVFAKTILGTGAKGYGLLMTATGSGALIGALTLATLHDMKYRGRFILIASIIFVAAVDLFAVSRVFLLSAAVLVVLGFTMVSQAATANTLLQTLSPDDLRGRVMAVFGIMFLGMAPVGSFQAGLLAQHFGAPVALMIGSAVMAVTIAAILTRHQELIRL